MRNKSRTLAEMGIMLAVMICLTALEHMIPPIPYAPPGVKLGLSNVVTMYALFFVGGWRALGLSAMKSVFVLATRGVSAGILSFCGGVLAVFVILSLSKVFKNASYLILSVAGAITHNIGQLAAASVLLGADVLSYYWPVLLVSGVIMGSATSVILRIVIPHINVITRRKT